MTYLIKAPTESYGNKGAVMALTHKGHQDKWMEESSRREYFDAHTQLIGNNRYHVTYAKLKTTNIWKNEDTTLVITILPSCDLINEVDLHLPVLRHPSNAIDSVSLNQIIKRIDVHYGGFRIDALNTDDINTQLRVNCDIWKRKLTFHTHDETVLIPLLMAPFYATNLVFPSTEYHDLKVEITFRENYIKHERIQSLITSDSLVSLYANSYYVQPENHHALYNNQHHIVTFQNQYTGKELLRKGLNTIKLYFNHPLYLMYFWGFTINKVKNIKVLLNKEIYYDGPVTPLIHKQRQRGILQDNVLTVFFSPDEVGAPTMSSVNFSRLDYTELVIDTEEDNECVYLVGINMQPMVYMNGMVGLIYAK